jgi:hypothetical protein
MIKLEQFKQSKVRDLLIRDPIKGKTVFKKVALSTKRMLLALLFNLLSLIQFNLVREPQMFSQDNKNLQQLLSNSSSNKIKSVVSNLTELWQENGNN